MSRAIGICDVSIIPGTLVCVADQKRNRGSGGFSLENARKDLDQIAFLKGGFVTNLTGFTEVKKNLDILLAEGKSGRTAVKNSTDRLYLRFAPGGNYDFYFRMMTDSFV